MVINKCVFLILIAGCVLVGCDRGNDVPGTTFAKVKLSPDQIVELKGRADTNMAAALTLSRYYQFTETNAHEAASYMVKVASKTGDPSDQYDAGILLLRSGSKTNVVAARKWLETAAGNGYKPARTALEANKGRFGAK